MDLRKLVLRKLLNFYRTPTSSHDHTITRSHDHTITRRHDDDEYDDDDDDAGVNRKCDTFVS